MSQESLLLEHVSGLYIHPQIGNTDCEFVIQLLYSALSEWKHNGLPQWTVGAATRISQAPIQRCSEV